MAAWLENPTSAMPKATPTPATQCYFGEAAECDECFRDATVICKKSGELFCPDHSPLKRKRCMYREHPSVTLINAAASVRRELGLHGSVTSGTMFHSGTIAKFEGVQTIVVAQRFMTASKRQDGVSRMPELNPMRMGPVVLCDGKTVWSRLLSNGITSLRWYNTQSKQESDDMGALIRADCYAIREKFEYPNFCNKFGMALIGVRMPALLPHLLPARINDNSTPDEVAASVRELAAIEARMPPPERELMQVGATLSVLEARALFCALYARLAEPLLSDVRMRIRMGVSYHVANCACFLEDPAVYFENLENCRFQEEATLTCMLMNVAPWDDYIRRRVRDAECGTDSHAVFASVIGLFFGVRYSCRDLVQHVATR